MMFGIGELFALLCAISWACAVILFKHIGNSLTANQLNLIKNLLAVSLLVPTAMLVEGFRFPVLGLWQWGVMFVSGYIGIAVADTLYLQALRLLGAGRTAIVASLYSPFVLILSLLFLGESLQSSQWLGFVLVIAGILVVVYQRQPANIERADLMEGAWLAIGSVFMTAAGVVAMKPLLVNDGFFWMVSFRLLAGIAGMLIYLALRRQLASSWQNIRYGDHPWIAIVVAAFVGTYLAMILWLAGFKYADASVASVLNETSSVFIVLLAWVFLKEKLQKRKLLGVVMTFSGVLMFLGVL